MPHGPPLGKKFELVTFDDKLQPSEALIALKSITDQNIPFVMQCVGSNVGSALIDAVAKNNERNPDHRVIYLNCGALATELTNEQCNFWHFRFTGIVEQRAYARIKSLPDDVKKVYLINQDYVFGQLGRARHQEVPAAASSGHQDRRRRVRPAGPGEGLLALHHQDQGIRAPSPIITGN